jgi:hypothetical protein
MPKARSNGRGAPRTSRTDKKRVKAIPRVKTVSRKLRSRKTVAQKNAALKTSVKKRAAARARARERAAIDRIVVGPFLDRDLFVRFPFRVDVVRPDDLLHLTFQFINLVLDTSAAPPARLVRHHPGKAAYIVVHFPPQHVGEQAFFEVDANFSTTITSSDPLIRPAQARLAGPSRLAFRLPAGMDELPYTVDALLDWGKLEPSLVPAALPPPPPLMYYEVWQDGLPITVAAIIEPPTVLMKVGARSPRGVQTIGADRLTPITVGSKVQPNLRLRAIPPIIRPELYHTSIEAPWRLMLSPNKYGRWAHASAPVTRTTAAGERTELWHTRLGFATIDGSVDEEDDTYRTLRAIWSPDFDPDLTSGHSNFPFRMSLDARDRNELVVLTADHSISGSQARVVQADRLMLTSLGAWLDLRYAAPVPRLRPSRNSSLTVEQWRHQATMARDQYVRVVTKGFLLPFGHRASLVKVTERKFTKTGGGYVAFLFQRMYIIVRQPEKQYPGYAQQHDGRLMPFRRVRITTRVTPNLEDPVSSEIDGHGQSAFWPRVQGTDFLFHLVAEDADGQRCEFSAPLIFVDASVAYQSAAMDAVINSYTDGTNTTNVARRKRPLFGQNVAFAESDAATTGGTTLETVTVTLGAEPPLAKSSSALELQDQPRCHPTVAEAEVHLPALKQVAGGAPPARIAIHDKYRDHGFAGDNAAGQIFARLVNALPFQFPADKSGGVATPNMSILGLSRKFGPLGGTNATKIDGLAGGTFDPKDFFAGAGAKILGAIDLGEIVAAAFADGKNVPKVTTTPTYPGGNKLAPPQAIDTVVEWKPDVIGFGPFKPSPASRLEVTARLHTDLAAAGASTYQVDGLLTEFDMDLFGFIVLKFAKVQFAAKSGQKMDVTPDITEVTFGGPLEFVNELKDYLNTGVGGSGFSLDVSPAGVRTSLTLAIPTVGVGILTIQNISFSAGLHLPFTGQPVRLRFAFCEREHPFVLTVLGLGGGGFFAIGIGLDGVELLEAALEFGASAAIDIGVASGSVTIMAGIYYKWEDKGGGVEIALLTGYIRMGGELEVLAIVHISVEFYLALSYESGPNGGKVWGEATLTVEVEVLCFSKSVQLSVRREFADPDPITFAQLMNQNTWDAYCEAFAVREGDGA